MTPKRPPAQFEFVVPEPLEREDLGNLLRAIRKASKLTQVELAKLLGLPFQNVSRLETGEREGKVRTVSRYVRALGLELVLVVRPRTARREPKRAPPATATVRGRPRGR